MSEIVNLFDYMSAPRKLDVYPTWMLDLAFAFTRKGLRKHSYTFDSPEEAARYRKQFYGLKDAIRRASAEDRADYSEFLAARLVISGSDLHILHADEFLPEPRTAK